jgi:hypothetical protein
MVFYIKKISISSPSILQVFLYMNVLVMNVFCLFWGAILNPASPKRKEKEREPIKQKKRGWKQAKNRGADFSIKICKILPNQREQERVMFLAFRLILYSCIHVIEYDCP